MTGVVIRSAAQRDLVRLQEIEISAGQAFRSVGMPEIADDPPPSLHVLRGFVAGGHAWVAERDGEAAGYVVVDVVDDAVHLEQVSVHANHAGLGIGRALVDHVALWARSRGLVAQTLTTFAEVPWNGSYYARLGFVVVPTAALTPGLREVRAAETARGLDRWPRVAMSRPLDPA